MLRVLLAAIGLAFSAVASATVPPPPPIALASADMRPHQSLDGPWHWSVDPYRDDGGPLSYVLEKLPPPLVGDRPLVFSQDKDRAMGITAEPMYGFQSGNFGRIPSALKPAQYRDLSRFEPPPSPQAVNGDQSKSNTPGDQPEKDDDPKQP